MVDIVVFGSAAVVGTDSVGLDSIGKGKLGVTWLDNLHMLHTYICQILLAYG